MKSTGKSISHWGNVKNKWESTCCIPQTLKAWWAGNASFCKRSSGNDGVGPHSEVAQMVGSLIFDYVGLRKSGRFQVRRKCDNNCILGQINSLSQCWQWHVVDLEIGYIRMRGRWPLQSLMCEVRRVQPWDAGGKSEKCDMNTKGEKT